MKKYLNNLTKTLLSIKSEKEMEDFLKALLTAQELKSIPARLEIVRLLKRGVSQREIAQQLGVGIATVTRGSRELQMNNFKGVA